MIAVSVNRSAPSATLTAVCDRDLGTPSGTAPAWVHLLPMGAMTGRDGRTFVLDDPGAVVTAFNAAKVDLPVDFEHQTERPGTVGPVPAAGWIKALKVTATGLWGRVEWTATARNMIAAREYRYLSPVLVYRTTDRRIVRLKGAGLVHAPNLELAALAAQEDSMTPDQTPDMTFMERFAVALGLPPDADAETILMALEKRLTDKATPDPAKFAPVAAMAELLADRNARIASMAEETATLKVDEAFRKGYLTSAMRPWAVDLCRSDPEAFDTFLETSAPAYGHLLKVSAHLSAPPPLNRGNRHVSPEADAICARLGLPPGSLKD